MKTSFTKISVTSLFLLFSFSLIHAQEESIVLKTATGDIDGTILVPATKTNIPVVIILAGSGPTDRNGNQGDEGSNNLKMIALELGKNNIASLRFDKRGIAKSSDAMNTEINMRFDDYINDAKEWVLLLAKDKRFSEIIIAGHSEGALIGMIAAENNKNVKAYISIAGAGRPIDEVLKEQLDKTAPEAKQYMFQALDILKKGDTISHVPVIYYSLFRPTVQPYMISWMKYNPQTEINKLQIPVLILQGTTDTQVRETDANLLSKAQPKATLRIIKNMNHVLKDCDTTDKEKQTPVYSNPDLPLNKELMTEMVSFIKAIN